MPTTTEVPLVEQVTPGTRSLARTGADLDRLAMQASMAMAAGGVAVAATRTRRKQRLVAFERWLADLVDLAHRVNRTPRADSHRWRRRG